MADQNAKLDVLVAAQEKIGVGNASSIRFRLSSLIAAISRQTLYDLHLHVRTCKRYFRFLAGRRSLAVFSELALETTAHCNRHCADCPVSVAPRGKEVMDEALFAKVIGELAQMKFSGRIALHFFNEPLLDTEIVDKVRRLAEAAPRATIEINSNGDFLTKQLAERLFDAGLGFMLVTAYNDRAMARLQKLRNQLGRRERRRIVMMRAPAFVGNRAGTLDHLAIPETLAADCFHPSYKLVINYKGEAVICTNDYFGKSIMGNIAEQSLLEIWRGPAFTEVRRLLRRHERHMLPTCVGCNLLSTPLRQRYLSGPESVAYNRKALGKSPRVVRIVPVDRPFHAEKVAQAGRSGRK